MSNKKRVSTFLRYDFDNPLDDSQTVSTFIINGLEPGRKAGKIISLNKTKGFKEHK